MKKNLHLIIIFLAFESYLVHSATDSIETGQSTRLRTAFKFAKGLGQAAINPKAIYTSCLELKQSIAGQDGIIPTLKSLQKDSLKTIIKSSDNVILSSFVTAHIFEQNIALTIQQVALKSIFTDLAAVGKSAATTIEQLLRLSDTAGNMASIIFFADAPEIMKNLQHLLDHFSRRLTKISTFFKPDQTNFLESLREQLHTAVDTSIHQSKVFHQSLKNEVGELSLEELQLISKNKDFSSLTTLGGKVALFFESFGTLKQFFDISIENMQELIENMNPVLEDLTVKIDTFKKASLLNKVFNVNTFAKEVSIPIEGLLLFSILLTNETSKTASVITETLEMTKEKFNLSSISNELLTEFKNLKNDIDLIGKTIHLFTKHLAPSDAIELIYLRAQVERITKKAPSRKASFTTR